ncbi:unnamed protein product [Arctia plantaginis]|uniref:Uncharacterized protein n=1 Tax=Arctia plantaginis TaxID=874455 RepID=A0A8S1BE36_ARCPL|nr:unnamed protein product [Arctia plantaginis]
MKSIQLFIEEKQVIYTSETVQTKSSVEIEENKPKGKTASLNRNEEGRQAKDADHDTQGRFTALLRPFNFGEVLNKNLHQTYGLCLSRDSPARTTVLGVTLVAVFCHFIEVLVSSGCALGDGGVRRAWAPSVNAVHYIRGCDVTSNPYTPSAPRGYKPSRRATPCRTSALQSIRVPQLDQELAPLS